MRASRLLSLLVALVIFASPAKNQTAPGTRLIATAVPYASGNVPAGIQPQVAPWLTSQFQYIIDGGLNLSASLQANVWAKNVWAKYVEGAYIYAPEIYAFNHDVASANGFSNAENMLLHFNQDYSVNPALAWEHLDQFDYFEQPNYLQNGSGSPAQAVNGAFIINAGVYTDVTGALYDGAHQTTVSDQLALGYAEPFDLINVVVQTPRSGGSVSWQYWNGRWTALPLRSDAGNQLTRSGAIQFNPPADWSVTVLNHSRPKYWVRAILSGASTSPVLTKVFGDDWASHATDFNVRGWNATDPNRLNVGMGNLEYNPTPPFNATARFRYQSRATGIGSPNAMFGNPSDVQNGKPTWATTVLTQFQQGIANGFRYTGVFFDDAGAQPQFSSPALPVETLTDLRSGTWSGNILSLFQYLSAQLKAGNASFKVGANTVNLDLALQTDFSMNEVAGSYPHTGNMVFPEADMFLPATNPNNSARSLSLWDNQHFGIVEGGVFGLVEQGTRTPIALLASYYMEANPNTAMQYNTLGWIYLDTDEFYYWAPSGTTLSAPLAADSSDSMKNIVLGDDSRISLPGGPIWTNAAIATSASQASNVYGYAFRIGNDVIQPFKDAANQWHTFTPILRNYPAGTEVQYAQMGHQAIGPVPNPNNVFYWANHFPAMDVDLGAPDPGGWNNGARDTSYIVKAAASGNPAGCIGPYDCPEFWRRDFMNAIIITHVFHDGNKPSELTTYGPATPIPLGATYYPLRADGSTGQGISQLQLRAGEAAILMKHSLNGPLPHAPIRTADHAR